MRYLESGQTYGFVYNIYAYRLFSHFYNWNLGNCFTFNSGAIVDLNKPASIGTITNKDDNDTTATNVTDGGILPNNGTSTYQPSSKDGTKDSIHVLKSRKTGPLYGNAGTTPEFYLYLYIINWNAE